MKNIRLSLFFLSFFYVSLGQNGVSEFTSGPGFVPIDPCRPFTNEKSSGKYFQLKQAGWDESRRTYEDNLQEFISTRKLSPGPANVITIPVVVHILYRTQSENISNNRVLSQIISLNQNFGRSSPDTINTPAPFAQVAANTGIQFCLASQDPNGFPTNGIERRQTSLTQFFSDYQVKFYSGGGLDQWDPTRYFNIWVCNMANGTGVGEFPLASPTNTYGAVVDYVVFGSNHTSYGNFPGLFGDYGITAIHEVGHCLNLRHIWGDDTTACTGTDYCSDTPNQAGLSNSCYTFPHFDSCSSSGNGIMFQNYMDYTPDACQNLFTQEQSLRMNAVLSMAPYNALATSNACQSPAIYNNDAGIMKIYSPRGYVSSPVLPRVVLLNWGLDTLYNCTICCQVDGGPVVSYSWNGSLPSCDTLTVILDTIMPLYGTHTFTAFTSLPNGMVDSRPSNDTSSLNFNITNNFPEPVSPEILFPTLFDEEITLNEAGLFDVEIYNSLGQKVYKSAITGPAAIDLRFLLAGTYFVKLNGEFSGKVIKY